MLRCSATHRDAMVATCVRALPDEGCGLLLGTGDVVIDVVPSPNVAHSAKLYEIDPRVLLATVRRADAEGMSVLGVFHSHTHSPAVPSPTDVAQAPDPSWHYVLVSLERARAEVRSFQIRDGQVDEEPIEWTA